MDDADAIQRELDSISDGDGNGRGVTPLWNDNVILPDGPGVTLKREMPHHRLFAYMRARGFTIREIAKATGYTPVMIGIALRQPFARKIINEALTKDDEMLSAALRAEAMPSIDVLVEIRDDDSAPKNARLGAAKELLDRYLGKATQPLEVRNGDMPADIDAIEAELASIKSRKQALIGA